MKEGSKGTPEAEEAEAGSRGTFFLLPFTVIARQQQEPSPVLRFAG